MTEKDHEEDKYSNWGGLLRSGLETSIESFDGINWNGIILPESVCIVGYDGDSCGLRIPAPGSQNTDWDQRTNYIKTRVLSSKDGTFIQVGFEFQNLDDLVPFLVDLIFQIDESDESPEETLNQLISRKRYGWEIPPQNMSRREIRGIIGELLVFEKIVQNAGVTQALDSWMAPNKSSNDDDEDEDSHDLHDFQGSGGHLEIKTSANLPGSIFIDNLDQMDHSMIQPLDLGIVYAQLTTDGSEFSLSSLADRIFEACAESGHSTQFRNQLLRRGYRIGESEGRKGELYDMVSLNIHWVTEATEIYTRRHLTRNFAAVVELTQVVNPNTLGLDVLNEGDWEAVLSRIGLV